MILFLLLIAHTAFFMWIMRNILFLTSLWQLKEYRFDRFFVHLRETKQGKDLIFSRTNFLKIFLILFYPIGASFEGFTTVYPVLTSLVFLSDAVKVIGEFRDRTVKVPAKTLKAGVTAGISFLFVMTLVAVPLTDVFLWLLVIDRLVPLFISYAVFFFGVPTQFYYDQQITKAAKMLARQKDVLVIGITGSYGKSSTKEFTAAILEKKFSVLKTQGTNNTPIGIAMTILKKLKSHHGIFVAEMGAYKRGEIRELCAIARPNIGILTAVNFQHLSLFGSLEDTMAAKFELIESLPKDGLALFNANNDNARFLHDKAKTKKFLYYAGEENTVDAEIFATDVVIRREGLEFDVVFGRRRFHIVSNLLGKHNIEDLLPGIFLGRRLGMSEGEIQDAVAAIQPLPMTIRPVRSDTGALFIDDTFNANPQALAAALEYLEVHRGRKILVLQPMIELGKQSEHEHLLAGKRAAAICDHIFLTNANYSHSFIGGAKEANKNAKVTILPPYEIAAKLEKLAQVGIIILFEGKEAGIVLRRMQGV